MNIKQALSQLDSTNNDHWTADGMPRIDAVEAVLGAKGIKRKDITNAIPGFNRETAAEHDKFQEPEVDADEPEADEPSADEPEAQEDPAVEEPQAPSAQLSEELSEESLSEYDLLQEELAKATDQMLEAQRVAESSKAEADRLANEVNALNRKIEVLKRQDPNHGTAAVRKYIKQQNQNRINRAMGLQRFVDSTGIAPSDLAKAVDPKAPLDRAMAQRRAARGSQRPIMNR